MNFRHSPSLILGTLHAKCGAPYRNSLYWERASEGFLAAQNLLLHGGKKKSAQG